MRLPPRRVAALPPRSGFLAHYWTKSDEEFQLKLQRKRPDFPAAGYRSHYYAPLYSHHVNLRLLDGLLNRERHGCRISFNHASYPTPVQGALEQHCGTQNGTQSRTCARLVAGAGIGLVGGNFTLLNSSAGAWNCELFRSDPPFERIQSLVPSMLLADALSRPAISQVAAGRQAVVASICFSRRGQTTLETVRVRERAPRCARQILYASGSPTGAPAKSASSSPLARGCVSGIDLTSQLGGETLLQ